jgi:SagB-type dehydrogenase family enzyme
MFIFSFYHWLSRRNPPIPSDHSKWPESWTTVHYKVYEAAPLFELKAHVDDTLFAKEDVRVLLKIRATRRTFSNTRKLNKKELSTLLRYACGESTHATPNQPRRTYPSGGARYPVEIYVYLRMSSEDISPGFYHYRSDLHALEAVRITEAEEAPKFFGYPWANDAAGAIFLTAIFDRSAKKYRERSYRYILLEAGHISQNILLVGEALGIETAALGGMRDELIEEHLAIDGYTESLIHAVAIG